MRHRHNRVVRTAMTVLLFVCASVVQAGAPIPIDVVSVQQIQIGTIGRGEERVIGCNDPSAAQFVIVGREKKNFNISVAVHNLVYEDAQSVMDASSVIELATSGFDVGYSRDGGETWHHFESEQCIKTLTFPEVQGESHMSQVLLRVGGVLTTVEDQQRGAYLGGITVTAEYCSGDDCGDGDSDSDGGSDSDSDDGDTDNSGSDDGSDDGGSESGDGDGSSIGTAPTRATDRGVRTGSIND